MDGGKVGDFCLITARCQLVNVEGVLEQEKSAYHHHHSKIGSSKTHQSLLNLSRNVEEQDIYMVLKSLPQIAY